MWTVSIEGRCRGKGLNFYVIDCEFLKDIFGVELRPSRSLSLALYTPSLPPGLFETRPGFRQMNSITTRICKNPRDWFVAVY
jgi:hypothetical protein